MDEMECAADPPALATDATPLEDDLQRTLVAVYDYTDRDGRLLYQILRYDPKFFRTRHPQPGGTWHYGTLWHDTVLYDLPAVLPAGTVLIVEGEKDVDTVRRLGLPQDWAVTTNPYGAARWLPHYADALAGKIIYICPDTDPWGGHLSRQIAASLFRRSEAVQLIDLPPEYKDISEWAEAQGPQADLRALIAGARRCDVPYPDEHLVHEVAPIEAALPRLLALEGVSFEWRETFGLSEMTGPQRGFIAQQAGLAEPSWVEPNEDGMQALAIRGFEALATEALRALSSCIDTAMDRLDRIDSAIASVPPRGAADDASAADTQSRLETGG